MQATGLPYLVAVRAGSPTTVLGYACASGFRSERSAYRFTSELTLFCDPEHTGSGIGSRLLRALLSVLKAPETFRSRSYNGSYPEGVEPRRVRHLVAVMAVDETGKRSGLALKEFYEGFGFVMVGYRRVVEFTGMHFTEHAANSEQRSHLLEVGYKFDRW